MRDEFEIGPIEIHEWLGGGAAGVVGKGIHRRTGAEVAVKFIRTHLGAESRRQFHREVEAHAGLVHPGIVYLFDYGEVPQEALDDGNRPVIPGNPYVAMEFADGGTVRDRTPLSDWTTVRSLLRQVLDALAHAHARRVIHRDLKPENFLLFEASGRIGRLKLADFGLAHALGEESERSEHDLATTAGTPEYMAPEQGYGKWREFGPWTDIYALGCIAWELVCGRPPYKETNPVATMLSHIRKERPPLEPRFPVPEGLESWIERAMAIPPGERFQRAADAARALERLEGFEDATRGEVETEAPTTEGPPVEQRPNSEDRPARPEQSSEGPATRLEVVAPTLQLEAWSTPSGEPPEEDFGGEPAPTSGNDAFESSRDPVEVPPLEQSSREWPSAPLEELGTLSRNTGLGLFALRETPFVDRREECDQIWRALREANQTNEPRLVLLTGEPGAGKSRLVDRVATRAHEIGAASVMRALHTPGANGRSEGIAGMVRRRVRGQKLSRRAFYEHLLERLPSLPETDVAEDSLEIDARALTELVFPTGRETDELEGPHYRFSSPGQKCAVVARLIRRYAGRRPQLVWLDDMQWGDFALTLIEHVIEASLEAPPALFVATLRGSALAEDPGWAERIDALASDERCLRIDLEPLAAPDHRTFVEQLLPLDRELSAQLARQTEGNPLFAVQLVRDWVDRDLLIRDDTGFRLRDDAEPGIPEDIHELWLHRMDRFVENFGEDRAAEAYESLELAAVLGREVDGEEWRSVCRRAGLEVRPSLVDGLAYRGLAGRTDTGWAFGHGLLVETLQRRAEEASRLAKHHRRCAKMLAELHADRPSRTAARRANHWIQAGELEQSLDPLFTEQTRRRRTGDRRSQRRVLLRRSEVLQALELPADDPRRIVNDIELARCRLWLGARPEEILEALDAVRERAEAVDLDRLVSRTWRVAAACYQRDGRPQAARSAADRALEWARRSGDVEELVWALLRAGWAAYTSGDLNRAEQLFNEGREVANQLDHADRIDRQLWELKALRDLGWVAQARGSYDRALERFERVRKVSREHGYRKLEAQSLNGLGEVTRFRGDGGAARDHYLRYRRLARESDDFEGAAVSTLNIGQVELMEGNFGVASDHLDDFERRREGLGRDHIVRLARLVIAAGTGEASAFDRHFEPYAPDWPDSARLFTDHPWLLEMAGDYARANEMWDRARRAWGLARRLWRRLEHADAAGRVDAKLEALDAS